MRSKIAMLTVLMILASVPSSSQTQSAVCTQTFTAPFVVTSGAPFNVTWVMPDSVTENGITVPTRINGFYVQIDGGPTTDIGMATALTPCASTSLYPNDLPFTYRTQSGVARGPHTLKISAWNFALDSLGNPTTTKQESVVVNVPFNAGDPVLFGPPPSPLNVVITK